MKGKRREERRRERQREEKRIKEKRTRLLHARTPLLLPPSRNPTQLTTSAVAPFPSTSSRTTSDGTVLNLRHKSTPSMLSIASVNAEEDAEVLPLSSACFRARRCGKAACNWAKVGLSVGSSDQHCLIMLATSGCVSSGMVGRKPSVATLSAVWSASCRWLLVKGRSRLTSSRRTIPKEYESDCKSWVRVSS